MVLFDSEVHRIQYSLLHLLGVCALVMLFACLFRYNIWNKILGFRNLLAWLYCIKLKISVQRRQLNDKLGLLSDLLHRLWLRCGWLWGGLSRSLFTKDLPHPTHNFLVRSCRCWIFWGRKCWLFWLHGCRLWQSCDIREGCLIDGRRNLLMLVVRWLDGNDGRYDRIGNGLGVHRNILTCENSFIL